MSTSNSKGTSRCHLQITQSRILSNPAKQKKIHSIHRLANTLFIKRILLNLVNTGRVFLKNAQERRSNHCLTLTRSKQRRKKSNINHSSHQPHSCTSRHRSKTAQDSLPSQVLKRSPQPKGHFIKTKELTKTFISRLALHQVQPFSYKRGSTSRHSQQSQEKIKKPNKTKKKDKFEQ